MKLLSFKELDVVSGGEGLVYEVCHAVGEFVGDSAAWYVANSEAIAAGYNSGERM